MKNELNIEIEFLNVDLENFRIGEFEDSREAYAAMIDEQGDKLVNLARDILEHGLSPAERLIVTPDPGEKGHFIVCEGNRRVTALRLLESPSLALHTPIYSRFLELSKQFRKKPIRTVPCIVMPSKDAAFIWIERKHNPEDGRGLSQWGPDGKARASAYRGKVRASKAVIDFLREQNSMPAKLERATKGKTTNLDRVFQMPYMAKTLGISIGKDGSVKFANGKEKSGAKLLKTMLERMTEDGFSVNDIRSVGQRWALIDSFDDLNCRALEPGVPGNAGRASTNERAPPGKRAKKVQADRKSLALVGQENILKIADKRLAKLYIEAREINPSILPNAAAILCRVFLELTTDLFLTKTRVTLPEFHLKKSRKDWADKGISLNEKIKATLSELDPTGASKGLTEARRGIGSKDALHYIENLHDFVHNLQAVPDPSEIKTVWEKWHSYFEHVFDRLGQKSP